MDRKKQAFSILTLAISLALFLGMGSTPKPPMEGIDEKVPFFGREIKMDAQVIRPGAVKVYYDVELPVDYEFKWEAPGYVKWKVDEPQVLDIQWHQRDFPSGEIDYPLHLKAEATYGRTQLIFEASLYYCRKNSPICLFEKVRTYLPVQVAEGGANTVFVSVPVKVEEDA